MFHIVKQLEYHLMQQLKMPNSKRVTKYSLLDSNDSNNWYWLNFLFETS